MFEEERIRLHSLPPTRYTRTDWRIEKVAKDYHIQVDHMFYSVPYEYISDTVEVRLTDYLVEVYFKEVRIASHKRLKGDVGQRAMNYHHMPDNHRYQALLSPESCLEWSKTIGDAMVHFTTKILESNVEKKALNTLPAVQSLTRTYSEEELDDTTETLLTLTSSAPTFSMLKTILQRNRKQKKATMMNNQPPSKQYGFVRGADFYGGKDK